MVLIVFIRHGKALNNEKDILNGDIEGFPLTRDGIIASEKIAQELKKLNILRLYCSPVLRAKQTADIIGEAIELTPIIDDRLTERSFGEMDNKPSNNGDWKFEIDWNNTTVESIHSIQKKMLSFIDSISKLKGIVVVVTHDSSIKAVLMKILNFDEKMENALKVKNSSISVISTRDRLRILAVNYPKFTEPLLDTIGKNL